MVCWGVDEWAPAKQTSARWLIIPAVAVLGTLGWLTYRQIGYWRNSETLWSYALRVTSVRSFKAHFNLAMTYDQQGRFDEAIQQLRESIDPRDDDPHIHLGLGIYDQRHGHTQDAIGEFATTLRLSADPALKADTYSDLGSVYRQLREYDRAKESFTAALQLNPNQTMASINLGLLAQKTGDYGEASSYYRHAMSLEPTAVGYLLLAKAEEQAGHAAEAQAAISQAKQLTSDWNEAQKTANELLAF